MDVLVAERRSLTHLSRRTRRAERRRLARCDVVSARLAELHAIEALLSDAITLVGAGWVQHGWFAIATPVGARVLTAHDVGLADDHPVTGACLVGSIAHASGGPPTTQLVQRSLDLTWHTLRGDVGRPAVLCPAPAVRTLRVLDLTRWNDRPGRSRDEVVDLLHHTARLATVHADDYRAEGMALRDR